MLFPHGMKVPIGGSQPLAHITRSNGEATDCSAEFLIPVEVLGIHLYNHHPPPVALCFCHFSLIAKQLQMMPPIVPPPKIRHISTCRTIGMRDWMAVKLTSKKMDEIKPAIPTTVHIPASNTATTMPATIIPSSGESTNRHAAFTIKSVLGFVLFSPNNDYTVCIKRETQTVSFRIRSSRVFLCFRSIVLISVVCILSCR